MQGSGYCASRAVALQILVTSRRYRRLILSRRFWDRQILA